MALLVTFGAVATTLAKLGYLAFFFGAGFRHLRGATGVAKGIIAAVGLMVCLAPYWLAIAPDARSVLFDATGILLPLVLIGFMFDYSALRTNEPRAPFRRRLRDFSYIEGMPALATFATTIAASAGTAIAAIISGQSSSLAGEALKLLFPTALGIQK
jgi:hypothetical protein